MSQLTIDPALGKDFEWEVGATYDMRVTGTVTAKTPDGGYTLSVTSAEADDGAPLPDEEMMADTEPAPPAPAPDKKRKSAVMMMIGKE